MGEGKSQVKGTCNHPGMDFAHENPPIDGLSRSRTTTQLWFGCSFGCVHFELLRERLTDKYHPLSSMRPDELAEVCNLAGGQAQLAHVLGVPRNRMNEWVRGKRVIPSWVGFIIDVLRLNRDEEDAGRYIPSRRWKSGRADRPE